MTKKDIKALLDLTVPDKIIDHVMDQLQNYEVSSVVNPIEYSYNRRTDPKNFFVFLMDPKIVLLDFNSTSDRVYAVRHGNHKRWYDYNTRNTTWEDCVQHSYKMIVLTPIKDGD